MSNATLAARLEEDGIAVGQALRSDESVFRAAVEDLWSPKSLNATIPSLAATLLDAFTLGYEKTDVAFVCLGFSSGTQVFETTPFFDCSRCHERAIALLGESDLVSVVHSELCGAHGNNLASAGVSVVGALRDGSKLLGLVAVARGPGRVVQGQDLALMRALLTRSTLALHSAVLAWGLGVARRQAFPVLVLRGAAHDAVKHLGLISSLAGRLVAQPNRNTLREARRIHELVEHVISALRGIARASFSAEADPVSESPIEDVAQAAVRSVEQVRGAGRIHQATECSVLGQRVPSALQIVLENLLDNAVEASSPGFPVRLSLSQSGRYLVAAIEDAGVGMSALALSSAPAEGFSSKKATTKSGVGLSLAKHLLEALGGSLSLESEVGVGTRASCRIPLGPVALCEPPAIATAAVDPAWKESVP